MAIAGGAGPLGELRGSYTFVDRARWDQGLPTLMRGLFGSRTLAAFVPARPGANHAVATAARHRPA